MGSVLWGIGMALMWRRVRPPVRPYMNADVAEYHVPVNADVHDIR